jgi:exosortase
LHIVNVIGAVAKVGVIISVTLALFWGDLTILFAEAVKTEELSYILFIPPIIAYLVYRKRKMLRAVLPLENGGISRKVRRLHLTVAILLIVTSVLLYLYGSYTFTPIEYHMLSLPIFTAGLILLFFNIQTLKQLIFPILFLFFLMPPPSEILYGLGTALSILSSELSATIARIIGVSLTLTQEYGNPLIAVTRPDGAVIEFSVDIACSGIYSLIAFFVFVSLIAYIIRDKLWKKGTLILIGIPIIYFLNVIRISSILLLAYYYGETVALEAFHLIGGWVLVFFGTLLLFAISDKILKTKIFDHKSKSCCSHISSGNNSISDFCLKCGKLLNFKDVKIRRTNIFMMIGVLLCVIALISIQPPVFALTQRPSGVTEAIPTEHEIPPSILPEISGYNMQFWYRDTSFEQRSKIDMALTYIYRPEDDPSSPIWVTVEIAPTIYALHRWEYCLIDFPLQSNQNPKVVQIELEDIKLLENPHLMGRYFVFKDSSTSFVQAVLYWYEKTNFMVNGTSVEKYIKISAIDYQKNITSLDQTKSKLIDVAIPIIDYWQPAKTWSSVARIISGVSDEFVKLSGSLLVVILSLCFIENRRERKSNKNIYSKLSKTNKLVVDAIKDAGQINLSAICLASIYHKLSGEAIKEETLLEKIAQLEETGVIWSDVSNLMDEPFHTWRTRL